MSHNHSHHPQNRAFAIGVTLNIGFVIIEAFYGHNLSDVLGLLLAWGASILAQKEPSSTRTYGFRRLTILASLISAILLVFALGAIAWEAIERFNDPKPINGITIIIVAAIGVVINTATALLFMSGQKKDLNIKAAYLHMAADAAVSLGVVVAGLAIMLTGWNWLDPTISLIIAAIILIGTWSLLRDSANLTIDSVPRNIDFNEVKKYLKNLSGVKEVHDLHIWALSTTDVALTAHLIMPNASIDDTFFEQVSKKLHDQFEINHPTLQIEKGNKVCQLAHEGSL